MRQILAVVLAVLAGLISCRGDVNVEIDPSVPAHHVVEARRAASDWNAFTSAESIRIVAHGDWLILVAAIPDVDRNGLEDEAGYAQRRHLLIRLAPRIPDDAVYGIVLHEMGHALGLRHVSRGVMQRHDPLSVFSAEDRAECERVGACP